MNEIEKLPHLFSWDFYLKPETLPGNKMIEFVQITTCDDGSPGIYILELVEGRVAHACGQLMIGDRILEIAHIDLWDGTPEAAARIIQVCHRPLNLPRNVVIFEICFIVQSSGERVDIIVSRRVSHLPASTIVNPWATDRTIPRKSHQAKQVVASLSGSIRHESSSL